MKLVLAGALALALSLPAFASDEGVVITSTMRVVLGKGGRIVGPFTVYGANGEKIFDIPAGSSVDSSTPLTSGTSYLTVPYYGSGTNITPGFTYTPN